MDRLLSAAREGNVVETKDMMRRLVPECSIKPELAAHSENGDAPELAEFDAER